MKKIILLPLILFMVIPILSAQERTLFKEGIKLNLKGSSKLGQDAMIFNYCKDVKLSKNCQELIVSKGDKKVWMPVTAGPVYNVLKTGKTNNYNGLTPMKSKAGKIISYYTYNNNLISFLTPVGKLSFKITIFGSGTKPLTSVLVAKTIQEEADDIVNCITDCQGNWEICTRELPPSSSLPPGEWYRRFQECTAKHSECEGDCKKIEMEHINTILLFRQTSAANNFNLAVLK